MSYGRVDLQYLNTSRCFEGSASLKEMKRTLGSLTHALIKAYCLDTVFKAKGTDATTIGQGR